MKKILKIIVPFIFGVAGGFLGALGGQIGPLYRRIGISVLLAIATTVALVLKEGLWGIFGITAFSIWGVNSIGYGMPSFIPGYEDEGSAVGKFFYNLFKGNYKSARLAVRALLGFLKCLTILCIPIIIGGWISWTLWGVLALLLITNSVIWGAVVDNEGEIKLKDKKLLVEEFLIYFFDLFFTVGYIYLVCL